MLFYLWVYSILISSWMYAVSRRFFSFDKVSVCMCACEWVREREKKEMEREKERERQRKRERKIGRRRTKSFGKELSLNHCSNCPGSAWEYFRNFAREKKRWHGTNLYVLSSIWCLIDCWSVLFGIYTINYCSRLRVSGIYLPLVN